LPVEVRHDVEVVVAAQHRQTVLQRRRGDPIPAGVGIGTLAEPATSWR